MKYLFWFALILSAGSLGCRDSAKGLKLASSHAGHEIEARQNLEFSFNKDIYPDSLLQRWDSTAYLEFSPGVKGMFRWSSSSQLQFSPAQGFRPGTVYTARASSRVLQRSKNKYPLASDNEIRFRTAPLRIMATHLAWIKPAGQAAARVQLDLDFNYEVPLHEAAKRLQLGAAGQDISFTTMGGGRGRTLSVLFTPPADQGSRNTGTPISLKLLKGIPVSGTDYASEQDTSLKATIPSRFQLQVTGVVAQHSGEDGVIMVHTSQELKEASLEGRVRLEPEPAGLSISLSDGGLIISSNDLEADRSYTLYLDRGIEGSLGGRLDEDFSQEVAFGTPEPAIRFQNQKGMYLSSQGFRNVALSLVSVPRVQVTVVKVYENNLEHFMRQGKSYDYEYDEESDEGAGFYAFNTQNLGDTIFQQQYDAAALPQLNAARLLQLNFEDKLKGYQGVYVLTVASADHYWIQDSKIISISDIGLIVKQERNRIHVFANSIRHATPLQGVKVSFFSNTNQQMHTATTNGDGVALLDDIAARSPGFRLGMVTARMNDEFSMLWLDNSQLETSRFDVDGRRSNDAGLNAWIYAERNLYRPGETIHVSAVLRDENRGLPGEMPLRLRLLLPNGKEFASMRKILTPEGGCETQFALPHTAPTGAYTLQLFSGSDLLLQTYTISVEEFVPDRIRAALRLDKETYVIGDSIRAQLQADNLFGTAAADRAWDLELNLEQTPFSDKRFPDYDFSLGNRQEPVYRQQTGRTSATGSASIHFGLGEEIYNGGLWNGTLSATVFDETGRPVRRYAHFKAYAQEVFLGMKRGDHYVSTAKPVRIPLIALNRGGSLASEVTARVEVIKSEWHTVIEQSGSRYRYLSQRQHKTISEQWIKIKGNNTHYSFTPELSGAYEVRLYLENDDAYVSRSFYAWGYGRSEYTSFEVNNEGQVDITADRERYEPGQDVKLLFTTPFDGRMLVGVERNEMLEYHYVQAVNKSASLTLRATDAYLPNVYVSATLFRPMSGDAMPLTVAHGYRNIKVEQGQDRLPVQIQLAGQSRSRSKQLITVKTKPGAQVTIAAVDEGILQVKNYETPDPYRYFYQKVALGVSSYDLYPLLLPELQAVRSSTGADEAGADQSLRVNPLFVNRIKNVSFWSGILQADAQGIVRYEIEVPQFSGEIRVMAAAYKGKAFGSAEQRMKVADPVVISAGLPRFLSPGDQVLMPVTLSNTTSRDAPATITVTASGPLGVLESASRQLRIPANRESRVLYQLKAQPSIGAAKVTVTVKTATETFVHETDIGVRAPASLQKRSGSGMAPAGKRTNISLQAPFVPASARGRLVVGASPLLQFSKNLKDLVQYPYGCVEQTTSAAFPQIYYADLVRGATGNASTDPNPAYNVQQAILKLQSMQLSGGALAYWPGTGGETWWGTVFGAHFLLEARKAGFEVNARSLDRMMAYLKMRLQRRETELLYYNENLSREIAAKEIPYSLYVLALAGQPQQATMNYYKANDHMLAIDGKYLLAGAFAHAGQRRQAAEVMPKAFGNERASQAFGGSFYSYTRDLAMALNILMDVDPANAQRPQLARLLSEQMLRNRYLNTQEQVWGLLALGKIAREAARTNATATVLAGGKSIGTSKGGPLSLDLKPYLGQQLQLQLSGQGSFYYFWESSGITADGSFTEEDSYLKVRRTYLNRSGQPVSGNSFRQNELVVVRLSIQAAHNEVVPNVAITDMLPAGFEIENTRLTQLVGLNWIQDASEPDYMDIRDDRINFFTTARPDVRHYYYMVRAVSPGTYRQGPVMADAMYNGLYHSYHGAGVVQVTER